MVCQKLCQNGVRGGDHSKKVATSFSAGVFSDIVQGIVLLSQWQHCTSPEGRKTREAVLDSLKDMK